MFFGKKKEAKNQANQNDDRITVDTSTITTMVGIDTVVEGMLKTKSSIRINGTVIGDVRADGVVILTKTGRIEGTIEAESIIVAGVVQGNMSIRDKVNVEATGEIYGEVITKKFVIDEESIFQGNCVMNRDGKIIPVPPYVKESDKKEEEKEEASDKDSEKKESKSEEAENTDKESKADTKEEKEEASKDKAKEESKEDSEDEAENKEKEEASEDDEKKDDAEDTLIIADINDVEAAEDIPASDGEPSGENTKKNYVKKSKSLSVEIEEE